MKFYFNIMDPVLFDHDEFQYFTEREIAKVKLYTEKEAEPFLKAEEENKNNPNYWNNKSGLDLWPVYSCDRPSWEPVECKDEKEARVYLMTAENQSVFERLHDW